MRTRDESFLVLGGAGLVGMAVCRLLVSRHGARRVVVASLKEEEAREAVAELTSTAPDVDFVPVWGNLFVPHDLAFLSPRDLVADPGRRRRLLDHIFEDFEAACAENHLARIIREHQPDVIVDCVNTATGISYQDVVAGTKTLRQDVEEWASADGGERDLSDFRADLEKLLLSQTSPQLIRHVRFLYEATREKPGQRGTRMYVKVGTTGTGGMGLNIPFTHSEDRPSVTLLTKTEVAFGHTGLLFLMARTPDAPIVKEVKPAAMIGYKAVEVRHIPDETGRPVRLFRPRSVDVSALGRLDTREADAEYEDTGRTLRVAVVNTGENGLFALGEFAAITARDEMEFVTPEEIAQRISQEILGASTGHDVVAALDSSVMGPTYRAGLLRTVAMKDLKRLADEHGVPSIALGKLGPPELSKLLFEAHLLRACFGEELDALLHEGVGSARLPRAPEAMAAAMADTALGTGIAEMAISIGVPVLMPDGRTLLRGPRIRVPEVKGKYSTAPLGGGDVDRFARKGWIDLRPANAARWQERIRRVESARHALERQGSAAVGRETYLPIKLVIGELVAWVLNNEMDGYRIK
ncbi:hypothetical protein L6R50_01645 [Myxococcota bacterium]|nr:hypothetical protein [Myxococcota bacterium]